MEQFILTVIRRWFWLIGLATLVAGLTTYWIGEQEPPVYEARARLIVGPVDSLDPDLDALRASVKLMQTYAELPTTWPFLQTIIDDLDLGVDPEQLKENIGVRSNEETLILTISVRDRDPVKAMAIANRAADMLIRLSPSSLDNAQAQLKDQMRSQAEKIEADIGTTEMLIRQLEADFQATDSIAEQRPIMEQLMEERNRLSDAHRTLALLYGSLQDVSTNQVKIIEPARSGMQVPSQLRLRVLVGALAGLILSSVIALTFEYFDNTVRTASGLAQTTKVPLLGTITRHKALRGVGRERLVVQALPESSASESYRMVGTKLLPKYAIKRRAQRLILAGNGQTGGTGKDTSDDHSLRSVMISSAQVNDDTGEIAANLAVVLAQAGYRVTLVDANLHRPTIGHLFGLADKYGLTDLLTYQAKAPELVPVDWAPGLSILPSGPVPLNPFELLASTDMAYLIQELQSQVDFVIIAASPLVSVADSLILASQVDGVVIVAHSGRTRRDMVNYAVESLFSHDANIVGIVLDHNRTRRWPFSPRWTSVSDIREANKGKNDESLSTRLLDGNEPATRAANS